MTNTLAYYSKELIIPVRGFTVQAPVALDGISEAFNTALSDPNPNHYDIAVRSTIPAQNKKRLKKEREKSRPVGAAFYVHEYFCEIGVSSNVNFGKLRSVQWPNFSRKLPAQRL